MKLRSIVCLTLTLPLGIALAQVPYPGNDSDDGVALSPGWWITIRVIWRSRPGTWLSQVQSGVMGFLGLGIPRAGLRTRKAASVSDTTGRIHGNGK